MKRSELMIGFLRDPVTCLIDKIPCRDICHNGNANNFPLFIFFREFVVSKFALFKRKVFHAQPV